MCVFFSFLHLFSVSFVDSAPFEFVPYILKCSTHTKCKQVFVFCVLLLYERCTIQFIFLLFFFFMKKKNKNLFFCVHESFICPLPMCMWVSKLNRFRLASHEYLSVFVYDVRWMVYYFIYKFFFVFSSWWLLLLRYFFFFISATHFLLFFRFSLFFFFVQKFFFSLFLLIFQMFGVCVRGAFGMKSGSGMRIIK